MGPVLLTALLLSSCGKKPSTWPADVDPYVQSFVSQAQSSGHPIQVDRMESLSIVMENPGNGDLGICLKNSDGYALQVKILPSIWRDASPDYREWVLFHELAHCLLCQGHRGALVNGRPTSIVSTYLLNAVDYRNNKAEYLAELFGDGDRCD